MTTLRYKMLETVLRFTGARNSIAKAVAKGNVPSVAPPMSVRKRWKKSEFQGRDIWTCEPKTGGNGRVYVHQHGGAYVIGLIGLHYAMFTKLADMSGTTVILPDYPLPPEAIADEVIDFANAHFDTVVAQYGAENVKLGGDSAGGNLALAMCQTLTPAHPIILLSPWLDLDMSTVPDDIPNEEVLLEPDGARKAAHQYAGPRDPKDPLISPLFADPETLPQMMIFTGEKDLLYADIVTFSEKAKAAGKLKKLATYGEFGHYWMFYPTPDRESTLVELASILRS